MRVAIIGGGPKGMYALERLLDHASRPEPGTRIAVDLFEPYPYPGAGPNYSPEQPDYLIMNFAASLVDMWQTSGVVPRAERTSFLDWCSHAAPSVGGDTYPPRALVGRYLNSGFEALVRNCPDTVEVRLRTCSVEVLRRSGADWEVIVAGDSAGVYDEVLVATGHEQSSPYPVERWLSRDRVPDGASVSVRGFALTFIDVALALTEGRGGTFQHLGDSFRLRYVPPREPVGPIRPFSRTGRPMLAKPLPVATARQRDNLAHVAQQGRADLVAIAGAARLHADVLPVVARVARASLDALGTTDRANPQRWLTAAASGTPIASPDSAYGELRRSLAIATGRSLPDLGWSLGHAWRALYPATVARLGGGGLAEEDWPAFVRLSRELERVAFGPPAVNVAKLLALIERGQVDLSRLTSARAPGDVAVDAVLPGPGVASDPSTVAGQLLADGYIRRPAGRRGIDVLEDGSCRSPEGRVVPGLSAIGRPTEDAVIGNDTLSRALHPLADRWARRVVERCRLTVAA